MHRKFYNIVFYSKEDMLSCISILDKKRDSGFEAYREYRYAYCLHDSDSNNKGIKKAHYHLQLQFIDKIHSDRLFNLLQEFIPNHSEVAIKSANEGGYAYLIHANALDKFQYKIDDITCNFDREELEELIDKHRKITTNNKNAMFIKSIMFYIDENFKLCTMSQLCDYLLEIEEYDLLGWCSRNVYLVDKLLLKNVLKNDKFKTKFREDF